MKLDIHMNQIYALPHLIQTFYMMEFQSVTQLRILLVNRLPTHEQSLKHINYKFERDIAFMLAKNVETIECVGMYVDTT